MSVVAQPNIVTNGLVFCLDAGNPRSYPGSGTTLYDATNSGYNSFLTNGPTYSSANGGSIVMDGVDDYMYLNNATALQLANAWTQIICVRFNAVVATSYKTLFGKPSYINYGIIVEWYGNNLILADFLDTTGARNAISLAPNQTLNTWNIIIHSYDKTAGSNNHKLRVVYSGSDNSTYGTATLSAQTSTDTMNIGGAGLAMQVGPTLLYNRQLSLTEENQMIAAYRGRYGI